MPAHTFQHQRADHRTKRTATITSTDGTEIFYKDWGSGQPIVFSHGWPLSGDDRDTQMLFFLQYGYRVIAHDRHGHGRSTQTSDGHDMDHCADDYRAFPSGPFYGFNRPGEASVQRITARHADHPGRDDQR